MFCNAVLICPLLIKENKLVGLDYCLKSSPRKEGREHKVCSLAEHMTAKRIMLCEKHYIPALIKVGLARPEIRCICLETNLLQSSSQARPAGGHAKRFEPGSSAEALSPPGHPSTCVVMPVMAEHCCHCSRAHTQGAPRSNAEI